MTDDRIKEFADKIDITIKINTAERTATWWLGYKNTEDSERPPKELCTERDLSDERLAELTKSAIKDAYVELDEDLFNV
jgi:hypothetical protein